MSLFFHILLAFQMLLHAVLGCGAHHTGAEHASAGHAGIGCSHHDPATQPHESPHDEHAPASPLDDCGEPDCSAVKPELSRLAELDLTPAGPLCPVLPADAASPIAPDASGAPLDAARRLPASLRAHLALSRLLI